METSERNAAGRIVLAGGSGFLGQHLASSLAASGFEVVVLARRLQPSTPIARWVQWDGASLGPWARELDGAGALVNMAGRSVNCRYDARNREEILESRLRSTRVLADALIGC
ncbi:MAG: Cell division inhibitor, partial [Armatimonadetes bacterium]|nr:Cell division inhibitor [Armatimonadota bacterium]